MGNLSENLGLATGHAEVAGTENTGYGLEIWTAIKTKL